MPYIYQSAGMNPSFKNVRVDDDQVKVIKWLLPELSDVSQQNAADKRFRFFNKGKTIKMNYLFKHILDIGKVWLTSTKF